LGKGKREKRKQRSRVVFAHGVRATQLLSRISEEGEEKKKKKKRVEKKASSFGIVEVLIGVDNHQTEQKEKKKKAILNRAGVFGAAHRPLRAGDGVEEKGGKKRDD